MNTLFRNFFYAVGLVLLAALYSLNPVEAQFSDLVRLVQSESAQRLVGLLTIVFIAVEFMFGIGHRKGEASPLKFTPNSAAGASSE